MECPSVSFTNIKLYQQIIFEDVFFCTMHLQISTMKTTFIRMSKLTVLGMSLKCLICLPLRFVIHLKRLCNVKLSLWFYLLNVWWHYQSLYYLILNIGWNSAGGIHQGCNFLEGLTEKQSRRRNLLRGVFLEPQQ